MPQHMPMQQQNASGVHIKPEPGLDQKSPVLSQPQYNPMPQMNPNMPAHERAALLVQQRFGSNGAASINTMQQQNMQQQQQQHGLPPQQRPQQSQPRPTGLQMPQQQQTAAAQQQYRQAMARQASDARLQLQGQGQGQGQNGQGQQGQSQVPGQPGLGQNVQSGQQGQNGQNGRMPHLGQAQNDGAADDGFESVGIMRGVDADGNEVEMGRVEIDHIIRRKIESMGQDMEGGGLMLPLKQRTSSSKNKKRKVRSPVSTFEDESIPTSTSAPALSQFDGVDDSDEDDKANILRDDEDEDAINSDLDDPDDGLNEEEDDDDSLGHIMLCMYDKVQRVKNKWYASSCSCRDVGA